MTPHLTIAFFTSRKEPHIQWFLDSLLRELERANMSDASGIRIVVVDLWAEPCDHWSGEDAIRRGQQIELASKWLKVAEAEVMHVPPKPTVWQGPNRLTKEQWFAAASCRNTAICLAPDGWIAFVDDLSVLLPGWFTAVHEAMAGDQRTVTCGAYRKVNKLVVEQGNVVSFEDHPGGHDNRWAYGRDDGPVSCGGNFLFGCSLCAPVEAFISINGYPEICDGLGFEDCIAGVLLQKRGWKLQYDRRMLTYESEEGHHDGMVMKRSDFGVSPNDKSHAVLNMAHQSNGRFENYFGPEGIRGLRRRVLAGEPFPVMGHPLHEWYSGTPLKDL